MIDTNKQKGSDHLTVMIFLNWEVVAVTLFPVVHLFMDIVQGTYCKSSANSKDLIISNGKHS